MRDPCALPLVALRADETCPRCGHPAGRHRAHPSYQEETMTETAEPTRDQIEEWIDRATRDAGPPAWVEQMIDDDTYSDWIVAGLRLALRTLDAEAQLAEREAYIAEQRAITEPSVQDLARQLREATERAEKAERERDEEHLLATVRGEMLTCAERERDEARAKLAELHGNKARAQMHRRTQKAEGRVATLERQVRHLEGERAHGTGVLDRVLDAAKWHVAQPMTYLRRDADQAAREAIDNLTRENARLQAKCHDLAMVEDRATAVQAERDRWAARVVEVDRRLEEVREIIEGRST